MVLNLGDNLILTLIVGHVLALFLRNKTALLLGHRLTDLLTDRFIPAQCQMIYRRSPQYWSLPCLALLLRDDGALLPDDLPAQLLLLGDALLLQLRLVHSLALLLVDRVAGLDVELCALGVGVWCANLNHEIFSLFPVNNSNGSIGNKWYHLKQLQSRK